MVYHLTLEKGAITYKDGIYSGSSPESVWSPFNPSENGGWQDGDELQVVCTFDLNPNTDPLPPASQYAGLSVGACNTTNDTKKAKLINKARTLNYGNKGQLLDDAITESDSASDNNIFYKATNEKVTIQLQPTSRGILSNYVYKWSMVYNGSNTVANGDQVEIIFGYGDPQVVDVDS